MNREDIRNGWYKIEYGKNDYFMKSDYWPPNDEIVRVENDRIVETMNMQGDYKRETRVVITDELIKCMTKNEDIDKV